MIPDTWEILHSAPTDENNRVLLKIVAHSRNVGGHLDSIGQTDSRNFPERRIWLFRCGRIHPNADTPFLRTIPQRWSPRFPLCRNPRTMKQLVDRWHPRYSTCLCMTRPCKLIGMVGFVKGLRPKLPFYALPRTTHGRERQKRREAYPTFLGARSTHSEKI